MDVKFDKLEIEVVEKKCFPKKHEHVEKSKFRLIIVTSNARLIERLVIDIYMRVALFVILSYDVMWTAKTTGCTLFYFINCESFTEICLCE